MLRAGRSSGSWIDGQDTERAHAKRPPPVPWGGARGVGCAAQGKCESEGYCLNSPNAHAWIQGFAHQDAPVRLSEVQELGDRIRAGWLHAGHADISCGDGVLMQK